MVFWIGILFGCLFVWLAVKKGFYETWILLFNIIIAVHLAVFLGPVIAKIVPVARESAYNNALCMMIPGVGSFLILYFISSTLFTGQFSVPFTKTFDTCAAGFFGFLAGLLVWCFLSLLICITPISQNTKDSNVTSVEVISTLLKNAESRPPSREVEPGKPTIGEDPNTRIDDSTPI
ncbi:MAG: CvpA family protein [Planctomycetota bacterium]|jgi:hypothetical protein